MFDCETRLNEGFPEISGKLFPIAFPQKNSPHLRCGARLRTKVKESKHRGAEPTGSGSPNTARPDDEARARGPAAQSGEELAGVRVAVPAATAESGPTIGATPTIKPSDTLRGREHDSVWSKRKAVSRRKARI